jgi:hypothetical protein
VVLIEEACSLENSMALASRVPRRVSRMHRGKFRGHSVLIPTVPSSATDKSLLVPLDIQGSYCLSTVMAPPRARAAPDDSRSETSSTKEKERQTNSTAVTALSSKSRRNAVPPSSSAREVVAPTGGGADPNGSQLQEGTSGVSV